ADLMRVILYGGVFAYIFGMVLYGEIFGIPFHAPLEHPTELSWSALLGYNIPYTPPIQKLEAFGVIDLLLISVVASFIHLSIGYGVGFVNEVHHNKKHAISRIGWLFVLVGLFAFFAVLGRSKDLANPVPRVVNILFFDRPPLVWIPASGLAVGTMTFPYFAVACIVIGIVILLPTEGGLAPVETISLLANMMSYTRLAGVAVAKGAVALAFNTMLLPLIINEGLFETTGAIQWNSNIVMIVLGFILLFLAHAMVLILGAISASIQAIRLNYVEFFLKFYKGGGTLFSPFGERKREMEA
ncbi:MAG TPA: V-type ATPase 116kDa subunit family protein, partial [Thermoplasmata archaeon]|nr:V-type ATPase 116kDa subunit family protein [Thermoplasmata archaeon]